MNVIVVIHGGAGCGVLRNERVAQQLRRRPPLRRIPLQAARDEVLELQRRSRRGLRRLRHADCDHEAGPIPLPAHREGKSAQVELQTTHPKAPNISGVPIVLAVIEIRVYSLRTHVRDRPDR